MVPKPSLFSRESDMLKQQGESWLHASARQVLFDYFVRSNHEYIPGFSLKETTRRTYQLGDGRSSYIRRVVRTPKYCFRRTDRSFFLEWPIFWDDYPLPPDENKLYDEEKGVIPYQAMVDKGIPPKRIVDIGVNHKGVLRYAIEVTYKNSINPEKMNDLREVRGLEQVFEVYAEDILGCQDDEAIVRAIRKGRTWF